MAVPSKAKNLKNPVLYSDEVLAEARAHWADHCAFCHANNGSGDTEVGRSLYPKAPDMRKSATQKLTDGELYYTIENGIRLTGMPAWGSGGDNDEDSWKLVYFIRHLPQMTAEEEQKMESMNPKTPEELQEEQQEEQFLNGGAPPGDTERSSHHHH
jgi:mono/diheme cytochrome c family protein